MSNKIAVITTDFPAPGHPSFVFVEQLVNAMVDLGESITVIAPQSITRHLLRGVSKMPQRSYGYTSDGNRYEIYRPYYISLGNCPKFISNCINLIRNRTIKNILKSKEFDVLYAHFWENALSIYQYVKQSGLPLFVACGEGDNALEHMVENLSPRQKSRLVEAVKGVISVSSENKRKCVEFDLAKEDDIVVLPNCVDESLFHPADGRELRRSLGVADDDFLILFVGGFISRKGPNRLSEAIDKLADSKIKSVFVGRSMGGDSVLPSCKGIVYQGPMEHDLLPAYFNAADVFVLPTQKEGCSNAIVESLACGTPVISANRSFNDDILNDQNAILVDPDNVDEIANAIAVLRNNKDLLAAKKQYTNSQASNYSIKERAAKIAAFIRMKMNK